MIVNPTGRQSMARRKRRNTLPDAAVIRMLVQGNPKWPHGAAYRRFERYRDGMTVGDFRQAVGYQKANDDLWYDQDRGFVRVIE